MARMPSQIYSYEDTFWPLWCRWSFQAPCCGGQAGSRPAPSPNSRIPTQLSGLWEIQNERKKKSKVLILMSTWVRASVRRSEEERQLDEPACEPSPCQSCRGAPRYTWKVPLLYCSCFWIMLLLVILAKHCNDVSVVVWMKIWIHSLTTDYIFVVVVPVQGSLVVAPEEALLPWVSSSLSPSSSPSSPIGQSRPTGGKA